METVAATPGATPRPAEAQARQSPAGKPWLWGAAAFLAVAGAAALVLLRGATPPAPIPAASLTPPAPREPAPSAAPSAAPAAASPRVPVRTLPAGATVKLDGTEVAEKTPLELSLDPASEHRISLALEGYAAHEVRVKPGAAPAAIDVTLERLAPPGTVAIASAYALDVVWRGRALARGVESPRVQVPGGRQTLTLQSAAVFLKADVAVEVPPGGEVALEAPALGRLNVRATPDNCQVFVDDAFADYPPIRDGRAAAGAHRVSFKWPDGARFEQAIEVKPGAPAFAVGRKE
jgi:hypothetical protein